MAPRRVRRSRRPVNSAGLLSRCFETYGEGKDLATLRSGGTRIRVEDGFDALWQAPASAWMHSEFSRLPRAACHG